MSPHRPAYWEIEPVWLFYVFAALAVGLFVVGMARRVRRWRQGGGTPELVMPPVGVILTTWLRDGLFGARLFRGDRAGGAMHLTIAWGFVGLFIGTLVVAADHYLIGFLSGDLYLGFSVVMEVCGLALLVGIAWALIRRYLQRVPRLTRRGADGVLPAWLLVIGTSGFLLEGARLAAQRPQWGDFSFTGAALIELWPAGEMGVTAYRVLWWGHALVSLGLIAYLPWSKLLHAVLAPATLVLTPRPVVATDTDTDTVTGTGTAADTDPTTATPLTWRELLFGDACVLCGRCDAVCPSHQSSEPLSPRDCVRSVRHASAANPTLAAQGWYCTTCGACAWACPLAIQPIEIIARSRATLVEAGQEVPAQLAETLERLYKYQNPWLSKKGQKAAWQTEEQIPDLTKKGTAELLYFVGCTTALDTRAQGVARALVGILSACEVDLGTLGKKEPCCGDIARRTGEAGLFDVQRNETQALLAKHSVHELVTTSPHCWDTIAHAHHGATRAWHYTQLLARLLEDGRLELNQRTERRVTFHDPCYLARHNGVVDEPRRLIRATGATLVEMAQHGVESLCCGGGGGRMWQELPHQRDLAQRRLRQAEATGAGAVITACPWCLIMLEDARKTSGLEDRLEIIDLAELIAAAVPAKEG